MLNDRGSNIMMNAADIRLEYINNGANQVRLYALYCLKVRKYSQFMLSTLSAM